MMWVLFSVMSIVCITSFGDYIRLQHLELTILFTLEHINIVSDKGIGLKMSAVKGPMSHFFKTLLVLVSCLTSKITFLGKIAGCVFLFLNVYQCQIF